MDLKKKLHERLDIGTDDNDDAVVSDVAAATDADSDDDDENFIKKLEFFISEMFSPHEERNPRKEITL